MPNDPSYVRLANRLQRGMLCDVHGSRWKISGQDVKPFPTEDVAKRYVRHALKNGKLEPASKAEWEEISEEEDSPVEVETETFPAKATVSSKKGKKGKSKQQAEDSEEDQNESDESEKDSDSE